MTNPEANLRIDESAIISPRASVHEPGVIEAGVVVGPNVYIDGGVLLMQGAVVCPNDVRSVSSNGRQLEGNVTVGPGVLLHDEVELGYGTIVPTQDCIAHIGSFGAKNRVITIHGSDIGPLYSLGCHVAVEYDKLKHEIRRAHHSSNDSAASYKRFVEVFGYIGDTVQRAYLKEEGLVREIKDRRKSLGLRVIKLDD